MVVDGRPVIVLITGIDGNVVTKSVIQASSTAYINAFDTKHQTTGIDSHNQALLNQCG
jgi:hypothetical protein